MRRAVVGGRSDLVVSEVRPENSGREPFNSSQDLSVTDVRRGGHQEALMSEPGSCSGSGSRVTIG